MTIGKNWSPPRKSTTPRDRQSHWFNRFAPQQKGKEVLCALNAIDFGIAAGDRRFLPTGIGIRVRGRPRAAPARDRRLAAGGALARQV